MRSRNQASESTQLRVTMVFFLLLLSRNFDNQLISKFHRFVILCICWDTPSEKTCLWQLPIVSRVLKKCYYCALPENCGAYNCQLAQGWGKWCALLFEHSSFLSGYLSGQSSEHHEVAPFIFLSRYWWLKTRYILISSGGRP